MGIWDRDVGTVQLEVSAHVPRSPSNTRLPWWMCVLAYVLALKYETVNDPLTPAVPKADQITWNLQSETLNENEESGIKRGQKSLASPLLSNPENLGFSQ